MIPATDDNGARSKAPPVPVVRDRRQLRALFGGVKRAKSVSGSKPVMRQYHSYAEMGCTQAAMRR
jgi:hypothetical protein